ncbi:MAG: hypothetical protein WHV66_05525 [Anaerolineales bacterium]
MKAMFHLICLITVFSFVSLGCNNSIASLAQSGSNPVDKVLFFDDFSNPNSGWDTWSDGTSLVAYQDGMLRIRVDQPQYDYWSRPGKYYENVILSVDALKVDGPDDNDFGLICRYKDRNNFYAFLIGSDGYAGIVKIKDGHHQVLGTDTMQFSEVVKRGTGAVNQLRAGCVGSTLMFAVNGQDILRVEDTDFLAGEVGVIAGSFGTPGVEIYFDNFVAEKP